MNYGYFEDSKGNKSAMRLMSAVALAAAIIFAWLCFPDPDREGTKIVYGFLIAAFAPKAVQKFAEKEIP